MKKLKFLFLVPAIFAMAACGLGQEVNADKAKDIVKNMKAEQPDVYEATITMTSYDAEDKTSSTANYSLKSNADGEFYASIKAERSGGDNQYKEDMEMYYAKDDKYEEVLFMKNYDEDEKKDEYQVYVKKGNELEWSYAFAEAKLELSFASVYLQTGDDLAELIEEAEAEAKKNEYLDIKYYSTGNDNLTIKETMKDSGEEGAQFGESSITYDKGLLTSSETKLSSKAGDKLEMKITVKYPKSLDIKLPSDWESHLEQE